MNRGSIGAATGILTISLVLYAWADSAEARNFCIRRKGTCTKKPAAASLPVVRTWGDLLDQPMIALADGSTIRLGIEARSAPRLSSVFVYCLTQDAKPIRRTTEVPTLGPMAVDVRAPDPKQVEPAKINEQLAEPAHRDPYWQLYALSIPLDQMGKYRITLRDARNVVTAAAAIRATDEPYHAWMPFGLPEELRPLDDKDEDLDLGRFAAKQLPAAAPNSSGSFPIAVMNVEKGNANLSRVPLPAGRPRPSDCSIVLKKNRSRFQVASTRPLIVGASEGWEKLLVRWWINGQPVRPANSNDPISLNGGGRVIETRNVHFDLEPLSESLGIRPGDRIGMQVLYSPSGWKHLDPNISSRLSPSMVTLGDAAVAMVSNRIEWIAP